MTAPVLVVGSGLGGLSAALRLAEAGRAVTLIEARREVGGTAAFSGGGVHIWGAETWEHFRVHSPLSDPALGRALAENFRRYVDWLTQTGAPGRYEEATLRGLTLRRYQIGRSIAPWARRAWLDYVAARIRTLGGTILLGHRATAVERTDAGVRLRLDDGSTYSGNALIIASGGFQADASRLAEHAGIDPAHLVQRSVSENRGDGLALAQALGAATTERMDTVYGHLMPAAPCTIEWHDPIAPLVMSAFYAGQGIVVDRTGRRFVDEGIGELNGETINAAAARPPGLWVILDEAIRTGPARYDIPREMLTWSSLRYARLLRYLRLAPGMMPWIDTIALAKARGATVLSAPTLGELAERLGREGVNGRELVQTIEVYNRAIASGTTDTLDPPRRAAAHPILRGPYIAVKVGIGVSMTYGGIAIDSAARALDGDGAAVPGVYAVPGAAGGVAYLHYAGALAACGVFGLIAAETILAE